MSKDPTEYDGRGSFENSEVRSSMLVPLFQGLRVDPRGQTSFVDTPTCVNHAPDIAETWRRRFEMIVRTQGCGDTPLFFASTRTCLVWPIWARAFPNSKWVIVRRADEDIVDSCLRTNYMKAHDSVAGWQQWLDVYKKRFTEIVSAGLDVKQIWAGRMMHGHLKELFDLIDWLNLYWQEQRVTDFIAPILWKNGVFKIRDK